MGNTISTYNFMKYLKLIRYPNLIMLAIMQFIFRYGFTKQQNIGLSLADWQYALLVLSTICIAAGGYIINNIFDVATDSDNKPNDVIVGKTISENNAYNLYAGFTIIGVGIGFYLSNVIQKPGFAAVFVIVASTLYLYATSLKQSLLIGNIIVALLMSFSIIIIGIFDLYPATYDGNQVIMSIIFKILLDYAIFAFIINFIREIVKDLEDQNGDYNQGMNTLPIAFGKNRTAKLVFGLSFIPIICILYYINSYLFSSGLVLSSLYGFVFILAPLIYFTIKMWSAKTSNEFKHLSFILKFVMFFGIFSIAIITYNMKHHA
jgi:4-hydroxybenzoate polyprenyltransferase